MQRPHSGQTTSSRQSRRSRPLPPRMKSLLRPLQLQRRSRQPRVRVRPPVRLVAPLIAAHQLTQKRVRLKQLRLHLHVNGVNLRLLWLMMCLPWRPVGLHRPLFRNCCLRCRIWRRVRKRLSLKHGQSPQRRHGQRKVALPTVWGRLVARRLILLPRMGARSNGFLFIVRAQQLRPRWLPSSRALLFVRQRQMRQVRRRACKPCGRQTGRERPAPMA